MRYEENRLTLLLTDVYYMKSIRPPGEHGRAYLRAQQNRTAVRPYTDTDTFVSINVVVAPGLGPKSGFPREWAGSALVVVPGAHRRGHSDAEGVHSDATWAGPLLVTCA